MSDEAEFEAHLGILREKYRDRLAVYQQNLVIERQALAASPNPAVVSRLKMLAHDLAGSAGTFGHADVSEAAGELEVAADKVLAKAAERDAVIAPLRRLIREVELAL
jgi:HPt (histidine-containing phosphotransfer) domain-containing protein